MEGNKQEEILQTIPDQPEPPVIGKVTYHSIALSWSPQKQSTPRDAPGELMDDHDISYCLQEQDVEKNAGFVTVYEGKELHCTCTGLKSSSLYQYRLRATNSIGHSQWSHFITVGTTSHHVSSEGLHKAIINNDPDTVRTILESDPQYLNIPNINGSSPLMAACKRGRENIVQILISLGADLEYSNSAGKTCMMEACFYGQNQCVLLLHEAGASWSHYDLSGMSPLHWAIDGEQSETVELLLNKGLPVDDVIETTVSGWTPLLRLAATNGNTAIARKLIFRGADINRKDTEGQTPLMLACLGGHKDLVSLLLRNNCHWNTRSKHNKSALDFAVSFGKEDIVDLIKTTITSER